MSPKAKNWTIGIVCFLAGVIATIIGFFVLTIYVSFIQEHDEVAAQEETVVATDLVDEQTLRMHEPFALPGLAGHRCEEFTVASIPVGSWWTDGDVYFKVLSNKDDTLYMVGTNLSDKGMEITFVKQDDHNLMTDGASVFAMHDSPVIARQIRLADGSIAQLLVAYYDTDLLRPQALLQRYHGKGLEKQQVLP